MTPSLLLRLLRALWIVPLLLVVVIAGLTSRSQTPVSVRADHCPQFSDTFECITTHTPVPPTNTPITPTSTFTPVPPTSTFTPVPPTSTFTPVPPTPTSTSTPLP